LSESAALKECFTPLTSVADSAVIAYRVGPTTDAPLREPSVSARISHN
jgi:hypothetical protein